MASTALGSGDAWHRKSVRSGEYVRYTINQPDPDEPVIDYALNTSRPGDHTGHPVPALVNTFNGVTETPASSVTLTATTSANPVAEQTVTATYGDTTHTIYHSQRGCMVTRWKTEIPGDSIDQEWVIRGWHEGLGLSINPNIRWMERLGTPGVNRHNPTTGGQQLLDVINDDPNDLITSRLTYHANANGGPGTAFWASACNPLDWDVLSIEGDTEHGASATTAAMWWRHRIFQRGDPFYGSRERSTRITVWYYVPEEVHESEFGGDVYLGGGTARLTYGFDLPIGVWEIFDEAYWFDCTDGTLTQIDAWGDVPDPGFGAWEAYKDFARDPLTGVTGPAPFPDGYGAVILRRSSDNFSVSLAARVGGHPVTNGLLDRYTLPTFIHCNRTFHGIIPVTPDIGGVNTAMMGVTTQSFTGTKAGWHGQVAYVAQGLFTKVQQELLDLYTEGLLDALPDPSLMPSQVTAGTDLQLPAGTRVEYTRALQTGLGLRP